MTVRLYTGDEIMIFPGHGRGDGMKFICEFLLGEGRSTRPAEEWPARLEEIAQITRSR
jgi:hypothetical protein